MLRNDPAVYYTGSQDYAALGTGSSDHVAQPASSQPEVSYLDYAPQRVPVALIQQHSTYYSSDHSLRPAHSMTGNTQLSHKHFHPYWRQSRSMTASDQQNLSPAAVMNSLSFSSSSAYPVNPHISYPKISPSFPLMNNVPNQSSHNLSTNYPLAGPTNAMYTGHQHVPSQIENYAVPSSTSAWHSLSHSSVSNAYMSEPAFASIPYTPSTNQGASSDFIEVHSPVVNSALPYSSSNNTPGLPSGHWDSIPGHANQTTPDGCIKPSTSYPSIGTATSPSVINTPYHYSLFVAPNVSQLNDASHLQVHMAINGGQGNNIFGDQENNMYYETDDPINYLWNEIANVGAHHDAGVRFPPPRCHEGTHIKIQKSILDWAQSNDPKIKPLYWLSGPAGAGKSAIAQTIAETTNEGSLIASFFFWRGSPQRNNPSKLFLVIAHGLALRSPELRRSIGQVIKEKPSVLKASINIQLQKLIIEPLLQSTTIDLDGLIIIDALDECSMGQEQRNVLCLIGSIFSQVKGRLPRILICSRPEPAIQEMLSILDKDLGVLMLEDDWDSAKDVEKYLHAEFDRIRNCDRCKNVEFSTPWPSPSQIRDIFWHTSGQFIYATTIIRFIEDESYNPCEQLEKVLGQQKNEDAGSPFAPLDALYHQILSSYPHKKRKQLQDALRFVIYLEYAKGSHMEPDVSGMEILYDLPGEAERRAHSVIKGIDHGNLEAIHKSFCNYLDKRLPESVIHHSLESRIRDRRARNDKVEKLIEPTNAILKVLGKLSEANEITHTAFMVVSSIWQVVKSQHKKDKAMVALYDVMIETYEIAIDKKALNQDGGFSKLFEKIVRQSEECSIYLSKYMFQGHLRQVMEFWEIPLKISELIKTFEGLQGQFFKAQVEVTTIAVLDMRRTLGSSQRKKTLWVLKPSMKILRPKSHCMLGTRQASIGKILNWAFHGEQSILWISGIAGCGKSSLIGTLHNTLSTFGFNSRLAAFIRFDRSEYNDAGEFVKALAFLLANFDERFGKQIADVVERSHQIAETTDLSIQVQKLLINPLKDLSDEIAKEGRIVILVDGIDECSRHDQAETNFRGQLLELFANDKFRLLPFLRFVLASRPEEDIVAYLQNLVHIHHFPLDHTSDETQQDIHYFLTKSFQQRPPFRVLDDTSKRSAVELLAERASGLFIWAATVIKFIGESVLQRLEVFTREEPPKNALHALTMLYKTALESLVNEGEDDIKQNICVALGLIMVNSSRNNSCSINILCGLSNYVDCEKNPGIVGAFHKLRSLVIEVDDEYELLHKSFDDFLTSKDRAGHWYINTEKYEAIWCKAMITCTMDHLNKADKELPEALSSDLYQYAICGPPLGTQQDLSLYQSLQQKLKRFLLGYVVRWLHSFDDDLSKKGGQLTQRGFGQGCHTQAEKLHHDSRFMQKAWLGASCLQHINTDQIVVKDFFNIMLYNTALARKVTKTNADDQHALEWEVDNIYMSVFIQMAGGSNVYEEIVEVLDKNPIPPVVSLSAEMEMPIKIVSRGRIRMETKFAVRGNKVFAGEIEWGWYLQEGAWVPIAGPQNQNWVERW